MPLKLANLVSCADGHFLNGGDVFEGGEDGELTGGVEALDGGGDGGGHVVDGSEGDAVELLLELFGAGGVDLGFEIHRSDGFAEEGGFLVLGFSECYVDLGADEGDGDAGKAGAGAEIEQGVDVGGEGCGAEDGFEKVTAKNAFFIADGGEVGFGIPFQEEGQVSGEFLFGGDGEGRMADGFEELVEAGGGHARIIVVRAK